MEATVFIADLKESRRLTREKRIEAQGKLAEAVDYFINPVFARELIAPVKFSAGDSVQGVFNSPGDAINCYLMLKALLYPFEIRCGVGVGEVIGIGVFPDTNRLDGQAYHRAAEALELCKVEEMGILYISGTSDDVLVNQFFSSAGHLEAKQNAKRRVIINTIFLLDPIAEPALFSRYKESALKAFLGLLSFYGGKVEEAENKELLGHALSAKGRKHKEGGPILGKKVVDSFLHELLAKLLGVTIVNMRRMISKSGINEIKRCYICAAMLADRVVKKEH
ncbi:MAG: hypothetical protein GX304_05620 [Clostridiales bacterium]|jgi:hypothetical protein|nr:hypothetical protein [Clostridiales bacterium]